jgi:hypothetical protein
MDIEFKSLHIFCVSLSQRLHKWVDVKSRLDNRTPFRKEQIYAKISHNESLLKHWGSAEFKSMSGWNECFLWQTEIITLQQYYVNQASDLPQIACD